MKLYYFQDPLGNFGDDLNPWLWDRLMPSVFDGRDDELLVGIGTLINHRLPVAPMKHIFGSGLGYGEAPAIDNRLRFHAVRGFETAAALGLPHEKVITDAAILVRTVTVPRAPERTVRFGFMPTGHSIANGDWQQIAQELGFHYISCHWDVERVLLEMSRCEILITEAMHGAIVADALRIPWIPVSCYPMTLDFKWRDWLSSLDMRYEPSRLTPLYSEERQTSAARQRLVNSVKRGLRQAGWWRANWTAPPAARSGPRERECVLAELRSVAERSPQLSADAIIERHTERFLTLVERFTAERRSSR